MKIRRKRSHVPRIKGCHECSQRRVNCDLAVPTCGKCRTKGIGCSGYGIRYRFLNDLVAQGKAPGGLRKRWQWAAKIPPPDNGNKTWTSDTPDLYQIVAQHSKDVSDNLPRLYVHPELGKPILTASVESLYPDDYCLMRCFSEEIAPKLVIIDDDTNPWRRLVLPLIYHDDLVRDAILLVSTCYISTRSNNQLLRPIITYYKVIHRLRERQDILTHDAMAKDGVLVSLLLLLAAAMITGLPDFRGIFNLIEIFLQATHHDSTLIGGDLGTFLLSQIEKFRGYAAPFLSRDRGMAVLTLTTLTRPSPSRGWEEFSICCKLHPELDHILSHVYDLCAQACLIYTMRYRMGREAIEPTCILRSFRATLDILTDDYLENSHTLVFSIFIAAFESVTIDDQNYFSNILYRQYKRLGFANILTALQYLKMYWAGQTSDDWVDLMTRYDVWIF